MIDELLFRYLANIASEQERRDAEEWIGLDEDNAQYFSKYKAIWENSSNLKAYEQIDTESSLKEVKKRMDFSKSQKSKSRPLWIITRIAAILVISFVVYLIFRQHDEVRQELKFTKTESGNEMKTVILPDSTVVDLNRNSSIAYSENFNKNERRLIFEGEAFFEIKPNKAKPFIIETSRSETRILGTAFNLKAYKNDENESIVVTHGIVEFLDKSTKSTQKVKLVKGEMAVLSNGIITESAGDLNLMAWKTGVFIFKDEALPKALQLLSEYYQVDFKFGDKKLESFTLSGKYEKLTLPELLEILEISLGLKYEKKEGYYLLKP